MKSHEISSSQNDVFKTFKELLTSKGIKTHGRAFIFGRKAVMDVLEHHGEFAQGVVLSDSMMLNPRETSNFAASKIKIYSLKNALFEEMDVFGSRSPILGTHRNHKPIASYAAGDAA